MLARNRSTPRLWTELNNGGCESLVEGDCTMATNSSKSSSLAISNTPFVLHPVADIVQAVGLLGGSGVITCRAVAVESLLSD